MNKSRNILHIISIFSVILLFAYLAMIGWDSLSSRTKSGFTNYDLHTAGMYPNADNLPLLTDSYPYSGRKNVSNDNYDQIWWHYPIFREGSYDQITNNLRYYKNPDEGTCVRSEFCGALYKDTKNKSNYVYPLQPVPPGGGPRVNYYHSSPNMLLQPKIVI